MNIKKVIQWRGVGGELSKFPLGSVITVLTINLDIQAYYSYIQAISTLLCLLLVPDV